MAVGNSPGMVEKHVGQGSYYLWTYKDGDGDFLDGAKNYKLHIPAKVPIKDFWSVLVYDSLSRSELQNSQQFPSVSLYSGPEINAEDRSTYISVRRCRPVRRRTGSKPCPAKAGSRFSAFTAPRYRSSTRPGY